MSDAPSCSIVVPTHRRPDRLARCLEALAALDYPPERLEAVVVDDGGGVPLDACLERVRDRLQVRLVTRPQGGPAAARNTGARQAEGELLAFTDDDCRPARDWLRLLVDAYGDDREGGFGGHTVNALVDNPYAATAQLVLDVGYTLNAEGGSSQFFTTNNLAVPAAGYRELGGLDETFRTAEDRDFCARWRASGRRLTYVPEAIVYHEARLDLRGFWRQHVAYGRGARRHHVAEAQRQERGVRIDPGYYATLARAPFSQRTARQGLTTAALLGVWHVANTVGFVHEWLRPGCAAVTRSGGAGCRQGSRWVKRSAPGGALRNADRGAG